MRSASSGSIPTTHHPPSRILCLSNGHGEDQIAARILEALREQSPTLDLYALPLVGQGRAYTRANITCIGPSQTMPSGGFIYMDGKQLAKDVKGGLIGLTWKQWRAIKAWQRESTESDLILAVGDVVPMLFAWLSGSSFAFVGTAKSEYYRRDENGPLARRTKAGQRESKAKSDYHPFDRWVMARPHCKAVYPRDRITAQILSQWSIPVRDLGNPMMDGLTPQTPPPLKLQRDYFKLLLLPGSRPPEAYRNWELILEAVKLMVGDYRDRSLAFLAAISPGLDLEALSQPLQIQGWQRTTETQVLGNWLPKGAIAFRRRQHWLLLSQSSFADYAQGADVALAMAGTATEQFVGLGKPAFIIPGEGPQFTPAFAEAQTRLLGPSVTLVEKPSQVPERVRAVMRDPEWLRTIAENGKRRLGEPGAAYRIAQHVLSLMQTQVLTQTRN